MRTPTSSRGGSGWPSVLLAAGVVAVVVAAVWWWRLPEAERYYECVERELVRNGCARSTGSLAGPAVALTLGMMLIGIGAWVGIGERLDARREQRPSRRDRRSP